MIGLGKRISYAFQTFFRILSSGEIPREVVQELARPQTPAVGPAPEVSTPQAEPAAEPVNRAIQVLAILQRDGRLIDFFNEDISPYSDAQIGAAVRDLHQSCKQSLERYINLEPIIASDEGEPVTVQEVDAAAIKLVGNVSGKLPVRGVLRHRGWRVASVNLPPLPDGAAGSVIAPAEVEIP
jgi:hypothetical protein